MGRCVYQLLPDAVVFLTLYFSQGAVDIYGYVRLGLVTSRRSVDGRSLDSYPQEFDCSQPEIWQPVVTNYYEYHQGLIFHLA